MAVVQEVAPSRQVPAERPARSKLPCPPGSLILAWGETYLANYNAISAFFWFNIPLRLIQLYLKFGKGHIYEGTADYVRYVQTVAILELVHSATGTHSPVPESSSTNQSILG